MNLSKEKFLKLFGHRLFLARTEIKKSQKDIAQACGVTPITVARWEKGESAPTAWALFQIMEMTGKGSEWFVRGVNGEIVAGAEREMVRLYRMQTEESQADIKEVLLQALVAPSGEVEGAA